jgi:hypothetical protein
MPCRVATSYLPWAPCTLRPLFLVSRTWPAAGPVAQCQSLFRFCPAMGACLAVEAWPATGKATQQRCRCTRCQQPCPRCRATMLRCALQDLVAHCFPSTVQYSCVPLRSSHFFFALQMSGSLSHLGRCFKHLALHGLRGCCQRTRPLGCSVPAVRLNGPCGVACALSALFSPHVTLRVQFRLQCSSRVPCPHYTLLQVQI